MMRSHHRRGERHSHVAIIIRAEWALPMSPATPGIQFQRPNHRGPTRCRSQGRRFRGMIPPAFPGVRSDGESSGSPRALELPLGSALGSLAQATAWSIRPLGRSRGCPSVRKSQRDSFFRLGSRLRRAPQCWRGDHRSSRDLRRRPGTQRPPARCSTCSRAASHGSWI